MKKFCDLHWALRQIQEYQVKYRSLMLRSHLYRITEGAFIGGRKTKAAPLLSLMFRMGLIDSNEYQQIMLKPRGIRLITSGSPSCYDLNEEQKTFLASWYIPLEKHTSAFWLSFFIRDQDGVYRSRHSSIPHDRRQWTEEMVFLNVAHSEGESLKLHSAHYGLLADKSPTPPMTLEELMEQLRLQERLGQEAELVALEYEKSRLTELGLLYQASRIERISDHYVNAGYDLLSFSSEAISPNRYIEVKSVGRDLRFYWSIHELEVAKALRNEYFLYLVERVNPGSVIWMVQNPFEKLNQAAAIVYPVQFQVCFEEHMKERFIPIDNGNLPSSIWG